MLQARAVRARRTAVVALVVVAFTGSGVSPAQSAPGQNAAAPITVTTLRGPNGESLYPPSPLDERGPRALNERGQVVTTTGPFAGGVVLWEGNRATRISPEGVNGSPADISDRGQVVGGQTGAQPFSWRNGRWSSLPIPEGTQGEAQAVNNRGQVLGYYFGVEDDEVRSTVVAWWGDRVIEAPVEFGPGFLQVDPVDINDRGQAAFSAQLDGPSGVTGAAYIWQIGGEVAEIPDAEVIAINNRGQAVGQRWADGETHAFLWEDGELTDLGTLGGTRSMASTINDRGQVVGISRTEGDEEIHGFLWEDGEMTDLGHFGGGQTTAFDINNRGQIVGESYPPRGDVLERRAFLWEDGELTDLGALLDPPPPGSVLHFSGAIEINERGQIVGEVTTSSGIPDFENDVVLWTLPRRR